MKKTATWFISFLLVSLGFLSTALAVDPPPAQASPAPPAGIPAYVAPVPYSGTKEGYDADQTRSNQRECQDIKSTLSSNKSIIASLCAGKDQETCYEDMGKQLNQAQRAQALKDEREKVDAKAEKAEDKVIDLQKQIYDVTVEMNTAQKESADRVNKLNKEINKAFIDLNKSLRDADKNLRADYNKLRADLASHRKDLVQAIIVDRKKISDMYNDCRKQVIEGQQKLKQLKSQQQRKTRQSDLLSNAQGNGATRDQYDFTTYYASCTTDPTFKEEIENVITSNKQNVKELQDNIDNVNAEIAELKKFNTDEKTDAQKNALQEQQSLQQDLANEYQSQKLSSEQFGQRLAQLNAQLAGKNAEMRTYKTEYGSMASTNKLGSSVSGPMNASTYQSNLDTLRTSYGAFGGAFARGTEPGSICNLSDYQNLYDTIQNQGSGQ